MESKITVIIPVYKVEQYLRQCLDSVVNQTYRNLEIIIIDDGSPDNCGAICDEYAAKDERIQVIHKENGGLSAGWNDGVARATGEWIAFVDSDDWIEPDYFEKLWAGSCTTPADIVIAGGFFEETESAQTTWVTFQEPVEYCEESEKDELKIMSITGDRKHPGLIYVWNRLYRRTFVQREGLLFDIRIRAGLANDGLFNFSAFEKASCVLGVPYIGYHYRRTITSGSIRYASDLPDTQHYVLAQYYALAKEQNDLPAVLQALDAYALGRIRTNLERCYFHPENHEKYAEIRRQISEMKKKQYYSKAIWSNRNQYLSVKQRILKYALRLPFVWPLEVLNAARTWKNRNVSSVLSGGGVYNYSFTIHAEQKINALIIFSTNRRLVTCGACLI